MVMVGKAGRRRGMGKGGWGKGEGGPTAYTTPSLLSLEKETFTMFDQPSTCVLGSSWPGGQIWKAGER